MRYSATGAGLLGAIIFAACVALLVRGVQRKPRSETSTAGGPDDSVCMSSQAKTNACVQGFFTDADSCVSCVLWTSFSQGRSILSGEGSQEDASSKADFCFLSLGLIAREFPFHSSSVMTFYVLQRQCTFLTAASACHIALYYTFSNPYTHFWPTRYHSALSLSLQHCLLIRTRKKHHPAWLPGRNTTPTCYPSCSKILK